MGLEVDGVVSGGICVIGAWVGRAGRAVCVVGMVGCVRVGLISPVVSSSACGV